MADTWTMMRLALFAASVLFIIVIGIHGGMAFTAWKMFHNGMPMLKANAEVGYGLITGAGLLLYYTNVILLPLERGVMSTLGGILWEMYKLEYDISKGIRTALAIEDRTARNDAIRQKHVDYMIQLKNHASLILGPNITI